MGTGEQRCRLENVENMETAQALGVSLVEAIVINNQWPDLLVSCLRSGRVADVVSTLHPR